MKTKSNVYGVPSRRFQAGVEQRSTATDDVGSSIALNALRPRPPTRYGALTPPRPGL